MGVYKRILKGGKVRYRFRGSCRGQSYISPAKYETREDAEKAEKAHVASMRGDTLETLTRQRMDSLLSRGSNRDYLKETARLFEMIKEAWGVDTPVGAVTKAMVVSFLDQEATRYQKKGQTAHRVNHSLRILKALFNYGIDVLDLDIRRNPVRGVKLYPVGNEKKYIPSAVEVYKVIEHIDNNHQKRKEKSKLLFRFVLNTGCRINEALALKVEDVYDDTVVLYTRKAKNSDVTARLIPRPDCLMSKHLPERGRVFHEWKGYPHFLQVIVRKLVKEDISPQRWSWHNLRHKAASEWAAEGMTTFEIMSRLGHTNLGTTMGYLRELGVSRI